MMARTQISMDREMLRRARLRATERGVSFAEYVRTLVGTDLGAPQETSDVCALFDTFDSGGSHVAVNKDRMVADAISQLREE